LAFNWTDVSNEAKLYIVPLAPVAGGPVSALGSGLVLGASSLRFTSVRIIIANGYTRIVDEIVDASAIDAVKAALPDVHAVRLETLMAGFSTPREALSLAGRETPLGFTKPLVMGVLNVTPDSFSDGGKHLDANAAIIHARAMHAAGADIIDIGGESTRPGADPVWEGEECERVIPVITALATDNIPMSIDTRHSLVMEEAVKAGAHIINDVSALTYDPDALAVAAACSAPVVLMHASGTPKTMQDAPEYEDVLLEVYDYLEERRDVVVSAGVDPARIVLDPGIGFGKRVVRDNIALLNNIAAFHTLGCPLLLGVSRKRFIGALTGIEEADQRIISSVTAGLSGVGRGVQILRVHDVAETVEALKVITGMQDAAIMEHYQ